MRIADVNGFYSEHGGGVRRYVDAKFAAAARAGHELTVIAPGAAPRTERREGGRVVWVAAPSMPFDPRYRRFAGARGAWAALDAVAPDIVEGSSPWRGGWIAGAWPGKAARALVFHQDVVAGYAHTALGALLPHARIDALFTPWWAWVRRLSARFDVTVAGGEWLARRLAAHGVANAVDVPFGIEAGRFGPERRDETLRRELLARCGLGPDARLLLAVSRFHPEKRLPMLIEAAAQARREVGPIGLAIVGDGLARKSVERAAGRAGGVALLGAVEDRERLESILASADLFVHGSGAETYGLAVAEAIASALPVVVPDSGGAADLAASGRARLYRTGDGAACAQAIVSALTGDLTAPTAPLAGTLDTHFTALFALYEALRTPPRRHFRG